MSEKLAKHMNRILPACDQGILRPCYVALTPDQEAVDVMVPTLHNWVECVYAAFGHALPTGPGEVALLAVRELWIGSRMRDKRGKPISADEQERAAADPGDADTVFMATPRERDMKRHPTVYDDALFCVWTASTPDLVQNVVVLRCSVDAGQLDSTAVAMAIQCEGHLYHCKPGKHTSDSSPIAALHVVSQGKDILLARNATLNARVLAGIADAWVKRHLAYDGKTVEHDQWSFCCMNQLNETIHIHGSYEKELVKNWSTGCTAIKHHKTSARFEDFRALYSKAANKAAIPYLVTSSRYLYDFDEWEGKLKVQFYVAFQKPYPDLKAALIRSVLRTSGLVPCPGLSERFLPSFITSEFARAVLNMADELNAANSAEERAALGKKYPNSGVALATATPERLRALADVLRTSLKNACFTLAHPP